MATPMAHTNGFSSKSDIQSNVRTSGNNATLYVHGGVRPDPVTGAIGTPIYQSTTFVQESVERYLCKGYSYSRSSNPTVRALEEKLCAVEGGVDASCFCSGMAATVAVMSAFMSEGDHCVMPTCLYGGSFRAANEFLRRFGVEFDFVDFRDVENVREAIKSNTKMVFCETPANPSLWLTDLEALEEVIKEADEVRKGEFQASNISFLRDKQEAANRQVERSILFVCDATFATPCMLSPLQYGADVVLHSTTKYFDGHNLTTGGVAISRLASMNSRIAHTRNIIGSIMEPQTAFYTLITTVTLPLRFQKQSENAKAVANFLEKHPKIERVLYPGLESHPQRALALKQHRNDVNGGLLGFDVKGGSEAGTRLMNTIGAPYSLCENLGSAQSLITCPAVFTHAQMTRAQREAIGVKDGYIRVSVGLEDIQDLIGALEKALKGL